MTRQNDSKRAARNYMAQHPGTTYRQALATVTGKTPAGNTATAPMLDGLASNFTSEELSTALKTLAAIATGQGTEPLLSDDAEAIAWKVHSILRTGKPDAGEHMCPECFEYYGHHRSDCYHFHCDEDDADVHGCGPSDAVDHDDCDCGVDDEDDDYGFTHRPSDVPVEVEYADLIGRESVACVKCGFPVDMEAAMDIPAGASFKTAVDAFTAAVAKKGVEVESVAYGEPAAAPAHFLCPDCFVDATEVTSGACVRCGSAVRKNESGTFTDDAGYITCGDYTGHDSDGIFAPQHDLVLDDAAAEDLAGMVHHDDAWQNCSTCQDRVRRGIPLDGDEN